MILRINEPLLPIPDKSVLSSISNGLWIGLHQYKYGRPHIVFHLHEYLKTSQPSEHSHRSTIPLKPRKEEGNKIVKHMIAGWHIACNMLQGHYMEHSMILETDFQPKVSKHITILVTKPSARVVQPYHRGSQKYLMVCSSTAQTRPTMLDFFLFTLTCHFALQDT